MSNSFKDFLNSSNFTDNEKQNMKNTAQNIVSKYAGMNTNELNNILMQEVEKQKRSGTFDRQKLLNLLDSIKGFLPIDTYNSMRDTLLRL